MQGSARSTHLAWARPVAALATRATMMAALVVAALSTGLLLRPLADEPIVLVLCVGALGLPLAVALLATARTSELRAVRREADRQIASMAHDLKGPLSTVSSYLDLIAEGALGPVSEDTRAAARSAGEASARVRALVESALVQHAEAIAAQPLPAPRPIELRTLIRDVTEALRADLAATNAEIVVEPLPPVLGDPARLFRVFENLVQNAVKYARPGETPMVRITGTAEAGRAEILVRDHGIGIPVADCERVFEVAARAANGTSIASGHGLGLATVRRLVGELGGEIWVDPANLEGAAIRLSLPLAAPSSEPLG